MEFLREMFGAGGTGFRMPVDSGPAKRVRAVTPDDDNDLPDGPCSALYVGQAGDVALIAEGDTASVVVPSVPVGILPISTKRVLDTGTVPTVILALYGPEADE